MSYWPPDTPYRLVTVMAAQCQTPPAISVSEGVTTCRHFNCVIAAYSLSIRKKKCRYDEKYPMSILFCRRHQTIMLHFKGHTGENQQVSASKSFFFPSQVFVVKPSQVFFTQVTIKSQVFVIKSISSLTSFYSNPSQVKSLCAQVQIKSFVSSLKSKRLETCAKSLTKC